MPKRLPPIALVASIGLLAACEPPPKTVKALRYAVVFAESPLELTHGGGRWVEQIYFPDLKVGCTLVYEHRDLLAGKPAEPRLHAFPLDRPRNDLTGLHNPKPSAIEEIEVPAEVAEEVRKLAELRRRWEAETARRGDRLREAHEGAAAGGGPALKGCASAGALRRPQPQSPPQDPPFLQVNR